MAVPSVVVQGQGPYVKANRQLAIGTPLQIDPRGVGLLFGVGVSVPDLMQSISS